jgi:hypothetical protein
VSPEKHELLPSPSATSESILAGLGTAFLRGQRATILPHQVWNPSWGFMKVPGGPCTVLDPGCFFCTVMEPGGARQRLWKGYLRAE